jgi:two-component system response regulator PilR (NtrC family)
MSKDTQLPPAHILVLDDEPDLRTLYELTLLREGHRVQPAATLAEARECLQQQRFDLVITDMRLPDGLGLSLLRELAEQNRPERAIVITAYGSAESAVEALKQGAFDYLTKPVDLKQFRTVVATALAGARRPWSQPATLGQAGSPAQATGASRASAQPTLGGQHDALRRLVGQSMAMNGVKERILRVAGSMAPVMVLGESGTGKELVARAIHDASHRAGGPFVAVNCGAIPDTLIEAEFFGSRKGAYTGATSDREGYFSAARGGTLFLDEIGDLPLAMQAKLLRVIQERRVRPLGGVQEEQVDVRLLCATHKDLAQAVAQGQFRQDLFYRLNVIEIHLPALRERRDDLPALIDALMQRICHDSGQPPVALTGEASDWLQQHTFAGNVRELENLLHRALALCDGQSIGLHDLAGERSAPHAPAISEPAPPNQAQPAEAPPDSPILPADLQQHLDGMERDILVRALVETRGNRTAAAARLGLNLRQIRYRIARLGIEVGNAGNAADADDNPDTCSPPEPDHDRPPQG